MQDSEWTDDDDLVQGEFDPFEDEPDAQETEDDDDNDNDDDEVLDASQIQDFSDLIAAEREAAREETASQTDDARIQALLMQYLQPPDRPGGPARLLIPATALRELVQAGVLDRGILSVGDEEDDDDDDDDFDDADEDDRDDDDDDDYHPFGYRPRGNQIAPNGRLKGWDWFPLNRDGTEPGRSLARSGAFGKARWPGVAQRVRVRVAEVVAATPTSPSTSPMTSPKIGRRMSTSPRASFKGRRNSAGSVKSLITGEEERVRGVKRCVGGRGAWSNGMVGFGRDWARGVWGRSGFQEWNRECLPNTNGTIVAKYEAPPYIGQHSHDYSFFYTANQAFQLHLYSTQHAPRKRPAEPVRPRAEPPRRRPRGLVVDDDDDEDGQESSLHKIKTVQGVYGQWTVTDADLSRDNEWMVYSSITPHVHLLKTAEHEHEHTMLDFAASAGGGAAARRGMWGGGANFGIWSLRFSADQRELVAGASSGQIMVYDIEARQRILNVYGHDDDVNGVCFADESSTNVLVSASDDGYLKVWDRRSLASNVPSGVLCGHTEGITFCAPKGDGRYVLSNGKDQAMRLWDLRQMRSQSDISHDESASVRYGLRNFDYRGGTYAKPRFEAHPKDCSVMTYRGHHVLKTLIRCNFSPIESTGGQYLYTGGSNGIIYIYALDGRVVQVLDRTKAQPLRAPDGTYNDPSAPGPTPEFNPDPHGNDSCTVRDVSWNGLEPSMISTAWDRDRRGGDLAVHQWKGLGKGGLNRLEDWVEMNETTE
ncbi:hypothetical protein NliqN6_2285 [Naganishia liquefaciens]|uniref:WD40 repeat domain-containing protein n=1 Tax=Naganishia liquefaciens TaxID=104408 RepID=A0A8H3YE45_9TREE|nr:hypothetical protein NliqN6_2285 [Naganishia liquefaciens]